MSSTDSDDSEDDRRMALFREAADTELICDTMFKEVGQKKKSSVDDNRMLISVKSERYLADDEQPHADDDLKVPESMRNFVFEKLHKIIATNTEFVDVLQNPKLAKKFNQKDSVRLLKGFDEVVIQPNDELAVEKSTTIRETFKRPKRRLLTKEITETEQEKLQASAIDYNDLHLGTENWKSSRKRSGIFEYKAKNSTLHLQEPATEFTAKRKKNNWSESKIARKIVQKSSFIQ